MFFGVSHVDVPVRDLRRARHIYEDVLGFPMSAEEEGFVDLDAATTKIRLVESPRPERPASLRVEAADVEGGIRALEAAGATVLYAAARTERLTIEGTVADPDGNTIEYSFDQGVYAKAKEVWGS